MAYGKARKRAEGNFKRGMTVDSDTTGTGKTPTPVFTRGTSFAKTGGAGPTGRGPFYTTFTDPSDTLANLKSQFFEIYHIPTGYNVFFKAFLTGFSDNFKADYNKEQLFGRMDPIVTYKSTGRTISLSWTVPSVSLSEAKENMAKANMLISMLYPVYENPQEGSEGNATTMKSGPIFKVKFGNLITSPRLLGNPSNGTAKADGLPCIIDGFTYNPVLEEGFFDPKDVDGLLGPKDGEYDGSLYPQTIEASLEMTILHDHALGWTPDGKYRDEKIQRSGGRFPYGGNNYAPAEERLNKRGQLPTKNPRFGPYLDLQKDLIQRRLARRAQKLLGPAKKVFAAGETVNDFFFD